MNYSLTVETINLMWLLPVVFMLHDFEEIIMIKPWLARSSAGLARRFPRLLRLLKSSTAKLSPSAFALIVAEEFIVISGLTWRAVATANLTLWLAVLIGFFLHLLLHVGQFIAARQYVPVILTSVPAACYCLYAAWRFNQLFPLNWSTILLWSLGMVAFIGINMAAGVRLARSFDDWLQSKYTEPQ